MLRYLNIFVLIGVALIAISLISFATGGKFLESPGRPVDAWSSIVYLFGGALMLLNGYLSMTHTAKSPSAPQARGVSSDKSSAHGTEVRGK
ncbi:MAG: hypothetical protein KGJ62_06435 [Armatimonadetes bacterium]|nr:hypothetical protein [Armatimonadota bacterium]MDE2206552.1 hypothetical protein [Armatimonadota bacterium]